MIERPEVAPEVAIVGGGPAGVAAARAMRDAGVREILLIEREPEAGGIPRFCAHPTFGIGEFHRPMTGPAYADRLRRLLAGIDTMTHTTVTAINDDLSLDLSSWDGARTVRPKRLLLATGIREMSRAARLISGDRPLWVLTTGALQRIAHSASPHVPFRRPVIVGTELVSFSALLTLRHLGARPVAMIEPAHRISARRPGDWIARFLFGVPVLLGTSVVSIDAESGRADRVASVTVEANGTSRAIPCDAVIVTGNFQPEASLLGRWQSSLIDPATGGPRIDQNWRTLDPRIYAAGNLLRPVETAAWSFSEGQAAGMAIASAIRGQADTPPRITVGTSGPIRYVVPGLVAWDAANPPAFQLRVEREARGHLELRLDGRVAWRSRRHYYLPERRILLRPPLGGPPPERIEIALSEA